MAQGNLPPSSPQNARNRIRKPLSLGWWLLRGSESATGLPRQYTGVLHLGDGLRAPPGRGLDLPHAHSGKRDEVREGGILRHENGGVRPGDERLDFRGLAGGASGRLEQIEPPAPVEFVEFREELGEPRQIAFVRLPDVVAGPGLKLMPDGLDMPAHLSFQAMQLSSAKWAGVYNGRLKRIESVGLRTTELRGPVPHTPAATAVTRMGGDAA